MYWEIMSYTKSVHAYGKFTEKEFLLSFASNVIYKGSNIRYRE